MKAFDLQEPANVLNHSANAISHGDFNSLSIVLKIRQAIKEQTEKTQIAAFIKNEYYYQLESQFSEEETIFFTRLPHTDDLRIEAQRQHDHLKYLAWLCSNGHIPDTLPTEFADLLEEHIRFEDQTLLPHIENMPAIKKINKKRIKAVSNCYQIL